MDAKIKRIGIIGGGQLAMMLTQAAHQLGFDVAILAQSGDCPAYAALDLKKDKLIIGELSNYQRLLELANCSNVLTFEIEHIDVQTLIKLETQTGKSIYPSPKILGAINDKFVQKTFLKKSQLPVGKFEAIRSIKNFDKLARQFGFPFVIKSRKGGYDGGGNFVIKSESDLELIITKLDLAKTHEDYFIEKFVPFEREISVLLARSIAGEVVIYPIIETFQGNNVCIKTIAPSDLTMQVSENAKTIALQTIEKFDYIGVMAIEMFVLDSGEVLINEIAPRVHNSGHWTIDGSVTSQFEQHIRCITGMDLGLVDNKFPVTMMYNIFGSNYKIIENLKAFVRPNIFVYDYNKKESRPNRKMGHINIVGESKDQVEATLKVMLSQL